METPGGWEQSPEEGKQPHLPGWPGPRGWWAGCSACAACSSGAGSVGPSAPGAACKDTEGTWGRDGTKAGLSTAPKLWDPAPKKKKYGAVPELRVQQGVVVEDEGLEVHQAPHLWGEALQLVVAQVEVQQVR